MGRCHIIQSSGVKDPRPLISLLPGRRSSNAPREQQSRRIGVRQRIVQFVEDLEEAAPNLDETGAAIDSSGQARPTRKRRSGNSRPPSRIDGH